MESVVVRKSQLLAVLAENRRKHREEFEETQRRFREAAIRELDSLQQRVRDGKPVKLYVSLPIPRDHTDDYDRAIQMLEMSVDDVVRLSELDFRHLVQDEWEWKGEFSSTSSSYGVSSSSLSSEDVK